ncbi:caspase domain-containing protein [Russula brevipes]|nr:caspase domain-containing protein [Russula brevipes]
MGPPGPRPGPPPRPSIGHQYYGQGPHQQQSYFEYSQCTGRKIALCIGINYLGQQAELSGCINDTRNIERFLCESFGYKHDNIVVLTDDQHDPRAKPTRANIVMMTARPYDSLFFHYSGHGGTKNSIGDEGDGYDEVIYPMDFIRAGHIIVGDQMHDIMVKPLPPGCRLTAIFDASLPYIYSTEGKVEEPDLALGAGQDLLGAASSYAGGDIGTVMKRVPGPVETATTGRGAEQRAPQMNTNHADVISWSGCKDAQPNALTESMLGRQPQQSYQQLLVSTHAILRAKYGQKPQVSQVLIFSLLIPASHLARSAF